MRGALEHQMLEKVGEPSLMPFFIFGTDVIPEIYGYDWKLVHSATDYIETVREGGLGETKKHRWRRCVVHVSWSRHVGMVGSQSNHGSVIIVTGRLSS